MPYKFNEPVQQNQQNGEINKEQIRYNEVDSRRTVELFSDPNAALVMTVNTCVFKAFITIFCYF